MKIKRFVGLLFTATLLLNTTVHAEDEYILNYRFGDGIEKSDTVSLYSEDHRYYSLISDNAKKVYGDIIPQLSPNNIVKTTNGYYMTTVSYNVPNKIGNPGSEATLNVLLEMQKAMAYDDPELYWVCPIVKWSYNYIGFMTVCTGEIVNLQIDPTGSVDKEETLENIAIVEPWNESLAEQAAKFSSRYEQIRYVHDKICEAAEYGYVDSDVQWYSHNAVGIPKNGKAVCQGYCATFKIIMDKLGIPCVMLYNSTHMWNAVQMDDGQWYYIDVTWDDGEVPDYDYFLKGEANFTKNHVYTKVLPIVFSDDDYIPSQAATQTDIEETTEQNTTLSDGKGDVNSDGTVNRADYILASVFFSGKEVQINTYNTDVNSDGTVNRADYIMLGRFFAGR